MLIMVDDGEGEAAYTPTADLVMGNSGLRGSSCCKVYNDSQVFVMRGYRLFEDHYIHISRSQCLCSSSQTDISAWRAGLALVVHVEVYGNVTTALGSHIEPH
jgi:hypothetical protein